MAKLKHKASKETRMITRTTCIGRSSRNELQLDHAKVSSTHATLKWRDGVWFLRDLNSRNGTWINGEKVSAEDQVVHLHDELCFGDKAETWVFTDDLLTEAFVSCEGEDYILDSQNFVVLPDEGNPLALVYFRQSQPGWFIESDNRLRKLVDDEDVEIGGRTWNFHLPEVLEGTQGNNEPNLSASTIHLHCQPRRARGRRGEIEADEIEVSLRIEDQDGKFHDLGTRTHHKVLAELARTRLVHARLGKPESERGWMTRAKLAERLELSPSTLTVQIHRARVQVRATGLINAWSLFEAGDEAGMIRLGVTKIETFGI